MSIKCFVNEKGELGYRVLARFPNPNGGKAVIRRCTVYGTAIEAQAAEVALKAKWDSYYRERKKEITFDKIRFNNAPNSCLPLSEAFDSAVAKPSTRQTSDTRIRIKRLCWKDFTGWLGEVSPETKTIRDVTPVMAENYIGFLRNGGTYFNQKKGKTDKLLSSDTLNLYQETLIWVFNAVKYETGIRENPFEHIPKLPRKHAEREAYTEKQLQVIFANADEYLRPLFFVGLFTGLSEGDICTLKKSEINFEHHHIYRRRNKTLKTTGKISAVPMLPVLEDFFRVRVADENNTSDYVFPQQAADYLKDRPAVSRRIKTFLENDCGFETCRKVDGRNRNQSMLDFHSLRHTFCSIAGTVGIPLIVVKSIVGHMSTKMTELYSRHVEEQERLRWIQLFGNRLKTLPNIQNAEIASVTEPEREMLIELVKEADIETVRRLLAIMNERRAIV